MKTKKQIKQMLHKGREFTYILPTGWHLISFDPGFLFGDAAGRTIDLPEDVVDWILNCCQE